MKNLLSQLKTGLDKGTIDLDLPDESGVMFLEVGGDCLELWIKAERTFEYIGGGSDEYGNIECVKELTGTFVSSDEGYLDSRELSAEDLDGVINVINEYLR